MGTGSCGVYETLARNWRFQLCSGIEISAIAGVIGKVPKKRCVRFELGSMNVCIAYCMHNGGMWWKCLDGGDKNWLDEGLDSYASGCL